MARCCCHPARYCRGWRSCNSREHSSNLPSPRRQLPSSCKCLQSECLAYLYPRSSRVAAASAVIFEWLPGAGFYLARSLSESSGNLLMRRLHQPLETGIVGQVIELMDPADVLRSVACLHSFGQPFDGQAGVAQLVIHPRRIEEHIFIVVTVLQGLPDIQEGILAVANHRIVTRQTA